MAGVLALIPLPFQHSPANISLCVIAGRQGECDRRSWNRNETDQP